MLTHTARGQSFSLLARLCCPCYNATITLLVWKPFPVPDLVCQMGWLTPFHRRGSLRNLTSRGTVLHPGSRESATWEGTQLHDKQCLPAWS